MRRRRSPRDRRGFTLMEVLLVLAILVILGGMVGFYFTRIQGNAYRDAAKTQIEMLDQAIEMYKLEVGTYPTTSQGLGALNAAPPDLRNPNKWRGPYLEEQVPVDPWDNPYQYELVNAEQFRIWSFGQDLQDGTDDDVSN